MSDIDRPDDDAAIDRIVEQWAAQLPETPVAMVLLAQLLAMTPDQLRELREALDQHPRDARLTAAIDARIKTLEGK